MLFLAAAVVTAGILITRPAVFAKSNSQNDVQSTAVPGQIAPRLQNLGNHKFPVTTHSARAQLFINQGMMLSYGFNHAEAVMDLRSWNYWTRDMQPYPETTAVLRVLESVMARNPNHPGAIHLHIHTVELARPDLAEAGAERLRKLAPGAGHLVHMQSHIFRRIGRYGRRSVSQSLEPGGRDVDRFALYG